MAEIKTDCFAFKSNRECGCLNELYCKTEECAFYKTKEQYRADLEKYPRTGKYVK